MKVGQLPSTAVRRCGVAKGITGILSMRISCTRSNRRLRACSRGCICCLRMSRSISPSQGVAGDLFLGMPPVASAAGEPDIQVGIGVGIAGGHGQQAHSNS